MKNVLLATTALAMSAGFAAAEVTLSGDARMGILDDDGYTQFIHRARVKFTLSGESDSGFSFGASFRAGNASNADDLYSSAGEVFISGAFGTLTMGDIDNAAQATVGHVDGVGLTGLGDWNEIAYLGDETTSVRYDYASGGLSFSASVGQNYSDQYSVAAAYAMDGYKFSVGYEKAYTWIDGWDENDWLIEDHIVLGADATMGAVTVKARYGFADAYEWESNTFGDFTQLALSATYTMDALSLTGFYATGNLETNWAQDKADRLGIGAAYDLGGGASLMAGYAAVDVSGYDYYYGYNYEASYDAWDLGLSFSF